MNHYNMFAPFEDMNNPQAIPDSWYRYTRQEVDTGTKKSSVKAGVERWVKWENILTLNQSIRACQLL